MLILIVVFECIHVVNQSFNVNVILKINHNYFPNRPFLIFNENSNEAVFEH